MTGSAVLNALCGTTDMQPSNGGAGTINTTTFRKDLTLDGLAHRFNVAQFVSFVPTTNGPEQGFCRLADLPPNIKFAAVKDSVEALLARSFDRTVNIRSFSAAQSQSREFIYGLSNCTDVLSALDRLAHEGAYTIVNETVDISDGGVSGVAMGGIVEFRPDATPRGVKSPGFAAVPLDWATKLFEIVYGVAAELSAGKDGRLEFSIHPRPRGWKKSNVLYWEYSPEKSFKRTAEVSWPNDFSRLLGDKAYGLLVAHLVGAPVPSTTVFSRRIAPFVFGSDPGSGEYWIRTCPKEQVPGRYSTARGWIDPFMLMQKEDPDAIYLASILSQRGVPTVWSGAAIESEGGRLIIEGVPGSGVDFMLGRREPQPLPHEVLVALSELHDKLRTTLGSVRFEWVFDGIKAWVVQLHRGLSLSNSNVIVPGTPTSGFPLKLKTAWRNCGRS